MIPILVAGAAAAAALLTGCSQNQDSDSPHLQTQFSDLPKRVQIPKTKTYQRQCLTNPNCSDQEQFRAVKDYVGAVYGEADRVRFNEALTPAEDAYILRTFGDVRDVRDVHPYLWLAKFQGLKGRLRQKPKEICGDAEAWKFRHAFGPDGRDAFLVGGIHYCMENFAFLFQYFGVEADMAKNPQDWVIFLEESELEAVNRKNATPDSAEGFFNEAALFHRIAARLDIPVENPVIPLGHEKVILAMEAEGTPRLDYATTILMAHLNDILLGQILQHFGTLGTDPVALSEEMHAQLTKFCRTHPDMRRLTAQFGEVYGVDPEALRNSVLQYLQVEPKDLQNQILSEGSGIVQWAIAISNRLSTEHLKTTLEKHGRPNAFFQVGSDHSGILDEVYEGVEDLELPESIAISK